MFKGLNIFQVIKIFKYKILFKLIMFKDKRFLSWRRKSIEQKRKNMRKKSIELKKQNFLLKMQKKRAFQKFKCLIFKCRKKKAKKKMKYITNSQQTFIQKSKDHKKNNLFYIIDARFAKRGLDMPYSVDRWIFED